MESGVVRRIDDLGRVVIPKEIRRQYRFQFNDPIEIIPVEGGVLLKKYATNEERLKSAFSQLKNAVETECFATSKQNDILQAIDALEKML